jgi:NADH-quinone oxidoreductase subunit M
MTDLSTREILALVPLAVATLAIGLMPSLVFDKINDSVLQLVEFTKSVIH